MTVKPGTGSTQGSRLPAPSWGVRIFQASAGALLLICTTLPPLIAARENDGSLALAESEKPGGEFELPRSAPLSFQGRSALLERCIMTLSSLRFALMDPDAQSKVSSGCQTLADQNPDFSESNLVFARIALGKNREEEAAAYLRIARDAAPADGWLALQRARIFLTLAPQENAKTYQTYQLVDDLTVLLAGHSHLQDLAQDILRRPDLRGKLFPALESLGPEATGQFLSALYRAKENL